MAAHLSVATVIEKDRIHSDVAFVVGLEIDVIDPEGGSLVETVRLVCNNENITYQGEVYIASNFDFEITQEAGSKAQMSVTANDFSRAIQARMQQYRGGIGFKVRLLVINSGNLSQLPEMKEEFTVIGASAKDYIISFKLGAENPLARRFPFRMQFKDRCQWTYKGTHCGYAGPLTTCDFTLQGDNGCAVHGNTERFGGFPGIKPSSG